MFLPEKSLSVRRYWLSTVQSWLIRHNWLLPATDLRVLIFDYRWPKNRCAMAEGIRQRLDPVTLSEVMRPRFEAHAIG